MEIHDRARKALGEEGYRRYLDRYERKERQAWITWLLWLFLAPVGARKFYLGNMTWGIVYLLTLALLGVGWIYDIFTMGRQIEASNARIAEKVLAEEQRAQPF